MFNIEIKYNGEYPCLCMGNLTVVVDENEYNFGEYCLESGGHVHFNKDEEDFVVSKGNWKISKWPDKFPEEYKSFVLKEINNKIRKGCCGGCI